MVMQNMYMALIRFGCRRDRPANNLACAWIDATDDDATAFSGLSAELVVDRAICLGQVIIELTKVARPGNWE